MQNANSTFITIIQSISSRFPENTFPSPNQTLQYLQFISNTTNNILPLPHKLLPTLCSITHQYKTHNIINHFKQTSSPKFIPLCILTLLFHIETNISLQNEYITLIYEVIKLYIRDITPYQHNITHVEYFINFISVYLYQRTNFTEIDKYIVLFQHNIDLMKYMYLFNGSINSIKYYVGLLFEYYKSETYEHIYSHNKNAFIAKTGLSSLITFACEENIFQRSNLQALITTFYLLHPLKDILLMNPLHKCIECFTNIAHKTESELTKHISYLQNQINLLCSFQPETQLKLNNEFILNETFYFNVNKFPLIKSTFNNKVRYPFYIAFSLKLIYDNTAISNQNASFTFKLSNKKNYIQFLFHKNHQTNNIDVTVDYEQKIESFNDVITKDVMNFIVFKFAKKGEMLSIKMYPIYKQQKDLNKEKCKKKFQFKKISNDYNQIEIGLNHNSEHTLQCELGKILIMNQTIIYNNNNTKIKFNEIFNQIKKYYFKKILNFTNVNTNNYFDLFNLICYINPLSLLYQYKKNSNAYYISLPNLNLLQGDGVNQTVFEFTVNSNISKYFHCVKYQNVYHFLFETEGFAYLILHCEFYYQLIMQNNKQRKSLIEKLLPLM